MSLRSSAVIPVLALAIVSWAWSPAPASERTDEARDLWDHYIHKVGCRDEVEVLACYHPKLRKELDCDNTAAGRARLDVHMAEMFELLQRDWDNKIIEEAEDAGKVTLTIQFHNRKKGTDHTCKVVFMEDKGRWWILEAPQLPSMLSFGKGTITMVAGIAIALGAIVFIGKKILGGG
jgi:hypothetical protein